MHKHPCGPETALTKRTFSKKILFSLQRNAQFDRQNLAKFGRANLAKFAFRVGFWENVQDPVSSFVRRFSVEIVFCWRRLCPLTYRHCQHLTYKRRSLLFELNELGMKFLTADHAASMVPVWYLIFSFRR